MKGPIISSKKITLSSDYNYFDLLPVKKYQQCSLRIPETVLLEKGYIKDWVFNSHKISSHPILKKRRENMSTMAVVRVFCSKNGYAQQLQGCQNIVQVRDAIRQALKQQKDYNFIKDKKAVEVITVSGDTLAMTLIDFLDYACENKYSDTCFYDKWKIIQEKISCTKIDEYYKVENVRNNHMIDSKCQKIIALNTTEARGQSSMDLDEDPFKSTIPSKIFNIAETKNLEGYKFFDTFLNKKFFQMSQELIQFIEKNLKCIVESVTTKFVINKERQPYLAGIADLEIKPAKKITELRQFHNAKEKGFLKIDEYLRCLEIYIQEHAQKLENITIHTPIGERRSKCRGKMCKVPLEEYANLPSLLQQKLNIPGLTVNSRTISAQLRDAFLKRRKRVLQKMILNKVIQQEFQIQDDSSEYETEGDNQDTSLGNVLLRAKNKQLKVCQNCYIFYFHLNRFYDLDMYGNMVEKKQGAQQNPVDLKKQKPINKTYSERNLGYINKSEIKRARQGYKQSATYLNSALDILAENFADEKSRAEVLKADIRPVTNQLRHNLTTKSLSKPRNSIVQKAIQQVSSPVKSNKKLMSRTEHKMDVGKARVNSNVKLDPITQTKQAIVEGSLVNHAETKGNRLLNLTKVTQALKFQQKSKSKTMHASSVSQKPRKPQNNSQAAQQVLQKLALLPNSSRQQFIYYAKKYYKDNLPQPIERRCFSTYYQPHLYEFMSTSPIAIHPKRRIKKRPEMSLKRLSELTDYPEIVSRSEFVFDTIIVNEQTTIPFCVLTSNVVNPEAVRNKVQYENIFFINDIFDCFIEHISLAKELLEEDQVYNKRIILFNYPGQSHTIYNCNNSQGYIAAFCEVLDKLVYRLSTEKNELKIIDIERDRFKFCGFGLGGFLLANYLGSYGFTFGNRISAVMMVNSFVRFPSRYTEILASLLELYSSNDPTAESQAHLYYNKAINSEQNTPEDMDHKAGLNPIRIEDRAYILESILNQIKYAETSSPHSITPEHFQEPTQYQVSSIYGKNNTVVPRESCFEYIQNPKNPKQLIEDRVFVEIAGGHDIFADNYDDIFRVLAIFARR